MTWRGLLIGLLLLSCASPVPAEQESDDSQQLAEVERRINALIPSNKFSADEADLEAAHCRRKPLTESDMQDWLKARKLSEPRNSMDLRLAFLAERFGYDAREVPGQRVSWTIEDLDLMLAALADFPGGLFPLAPLKGPQLRKVSLHRTGAMGSLAVISGDDIEFGKNEYQELSAQEKVLRFFHEFSHQLAKSALKVDDLAQWDKLGGWDEVESIYIGGAGLQRMQALETKLTILVSRGVVSEYAFFKASEDLAESITAYRYAPARLLAASKDKYGFIKEKIFQGAEFVRSCD